MEVQTAQSNKKNRNTAASDAETDIRKLLEDFHAAIHAGDIDKIMSFYARDVVAFDMMPPLQFAGAESYREAWQKGFDTGATMKFETHDLKITAGADVAFCHSLLHCTGPKKDGTEMDMWIRWTDCLRKVDGKWLIAHEQVSVPVDMESGKALFDLKPQSLAPN